MLTVVIDTKDKILKKLNLFKRKLWQKPTEHEFKKAEQLLDKLYTEMEEKGIQTGTINCTLFFNKHEIECDPFLLDTKGNIFTLQDLVNQDFAKSSNENTPKHIETLQRQINEEMNQYQDETIRKSSFKEKVKQKEAAVKKQVPVIRKEKNDGRELVTGAIREEALDGERKEKSKDTVESGEVESDNKDEIEIEFLPEEEGSNTSENDSSISYYKAYIEIEPKKAIMDETLNTCNDTFIHDYFGLESKNYTKEEIEFYKQKFINAKLKAKALVSPINTYKNLIEEETKKSSNQLSEHYKEEMAYKPEVYAEEKFEEIYAPVRKQYNDEYEVFENEQLLLLEEKNKKLEAEKKTEIEDLVKEIENKYQKLVIEEENRTKERINQFRDELGAKNKEDKKIIFQSLVTERVTQREQQLIDYKAKKEKELLETVETASYNLIGIQQELIDSIEEEMEKELPNWTNLVNKEKEQRKMEQQQQKEFQLKQEKLNIQKEHQLNKFALAKEKIDLEKEKQLKELELKKECLKQELTKETTEKSQEPLISPLKINSTDTQTDLEKKIEKLLSEKSNRSNRKQLTTTNVAIAGLLLFSLTGFGYLTYANNQTNHELTKKIEQYQVGNDELQRQSDTEVTTNELDTLLSERKFDLVYKKYTDKDSLKTIENYLVDTEDLPQMREFNKHVSTVTGKLNEAILEDNDDLIIQEYESIQDKNELQQSQKKRVKLAYYNKERIEEAKKVGE